MDYIYIFFLHHDRKNRNMYAHLLMHMIKKGQLDGPFSSKPELGPLPTLLSNMVGHCFT